MASPEEQETISKVKHKIEKNINNSQRSTSNIVEKNNSFGTK